MANGRVTIPGVKTAYFNQTITFNDLGDLGAGLFSIHRKSDEANAPASYSYWYVLQFSLYGNGDSRYVWQLATDSNNLTAIYFRKKTNGTWQAWKGIMLT